MDEYQESLDLCQDQEEQEYQAILTVYLNEED